MKGSMVWDEGFQDFVWHEDMLNVFVKRLWMKGPKSFG